MLLSIQEAIRAYPKENFGDIVQAAEEVRKLILMRFPLEAWPDMPLEDYALGQENSENTFCRWMEFKSPHLGSMQGGSARKLIIYKHKDKPGWYHNSAYKNEQEAWLAVRGAFIKAFQLARAGDFNSIDELEAFRGGPALRLKTLHLYFPEDILPVYSLIHIKHFLQLLGQTEQGGRDWEVVGLNRSLLAALKEIPTLEGWNTLELIHLLYQWADPRESKRIVKIAPGENAQFWQDCLRGGYICVGWDDVGDLRGFENKKVFREHFFKVFAGTYNNNKSTLTKKANELWTLAELEPGDIVVANQGTTRVLATGEVTGLGYEWMPGRSELRHAVHVRWDVTTAGEIESQKKWASMTIAPVSYTLYKQIIKGETGALMIPPMVPVEPLFKEIEEAIERKGQVILYGPPGTGKTFQARRFAVWWLLKQQGETNPQGVPADEYALANAEKRLLTAQVRGRVWWIVANQNWHWDKLFADGNAEKYRYGRIQRNYPLVQPGDLVIGYQTAPEKRIFALAKISQGLEAVGEGKSHIELVPVSKIKNGITLAELQNDPLLKNSEPIRFNNQGTLFALTSDEAGYLLSLLAERNPELQENLEVSDTVGSLTIITFHPSYSYEDFIEGFRPVDNGSGALFLRLEDGVFKRICREAQANPAKKYLLLVDEINRANVAKVFGELITLLEKDKRGLMITLPQSKENFTIPSNVCLLGTMNTADRGIRLLDAALRRRFAFLEMMPDVEILRGAKVGALPLDDFLEELNRRIVRYEGREKQIGHSFLLENGEPVGEPEELARRFHQEILPLLQEFCYDDYAVLGSYLGDQLVDREAQSLNTEILGNPDLLLEALEDEFIRTGGEG